MTDREFAIDVVRRLQAAGFRALWAGGCVRDELLGLVPADYDIATDARPEQVQSLFRRTIAVGAAFGVIEVLGPRDDCGDWLKVQVATFRSDGAYIDGRRPESVTFSSPEEDAQRRDFTVNGMFFDPVAGQVIDYVGGQDDLRAKVLRAIGTAADRFREDKLRILRAVRMATRFDLEIEPDTLAAGRAMAAEVRVVSPERISDELRKTLVHPRRERAVRLLREFNLLEPVLPELVPAIGLPQGPPAAPTGDLWDHIVRVMNALPEAVSFQLAFAALLHDVGKSATFARTPDKYTFHKHEFAGRRMAEAIGRRLRLSNDEIARVCWLVEKHMALADAAVMRPSRLKPLLVHPGISELLALHRADAVAAGKDLAHIEFCERVLRETPPEELNPPPLLTGDDLVAAGWQPGPKFKQVLDAVREAQLEGTIRTRDEAFRLAGSFG